MKVLYMGTALVTPMDQSDSTFVQDWIIMKNSDLQSLFSSKATTDNSFQALGAHIQVS